MQDDPFCYLDESTLECIDGILINICASNMIDNEIAKIYFGDSSNRKYCYISLTDNRYLFGDIMDNVTLNKVQNILSNNISKINSILKDLYINSPDSEIYIKSGKDKIEISSIPNYKEIE